MPLKIQPGDITEVRADAIVCPVSADLTGSGAAGRAIHAAAGPKVEADCRRIGSCALGQICVTRAGALPARYIIHAVWEDGSSGQSVLRSCYLNALARAQELRCRTVAFPLIGEGQIPQDRALRAAVDAIGTFLQDRDMRVELVLSEPAAGCLDQDLRAEIELYLRKRYEGPPVLGFAIRPEPFAAPAPASPAPQREKSPGRIRPDPAKVIPETRRLGFQGREMPVLREAVCSLEGALSNMGESFSEMLLRKIDEKGMTDSECYHRANLDRRLFSKIRSKRSYQPSKPTVLACAIALELTLEETAEMLQAAGFALSRASRADLIVEFFIDHGNYNILEINEALFDFGEKTLGS